MQVAFLTVLSTKPIHKAGIFKMKIFNIVIIVLGLFAMMRILLGIFLANMHQIKTDNNNHQTRRQLVTKSIKGQISAYRKAHPYLTAFKLLFGIKALPKNIKQIENHAQDIINGDKLAYYPLMSVVIPAFNEQKTIKDCVTSVLNQRYPNRQIIVVDDGSTDDTPKILDQLQADFLKDSNQYYDFESSIKPEDRLIIVHQSNGGKSVALNHGIKEFAKGEIVTVLDSDSTLAPDALLKMSQHFKDPKTLAMADNVRIAHPKKIIEHIQEFEYLLGYRLKGSEEILELEYIIGGIGSSFRRWALEEIGYYDTDTVTEDIDLTMKLLNHFGNTKYHFGYAEDVIAYTPPVHYFNQLLKQRYRWKYGRFKALFKYRQMIFSKDTKKYTRTLSWWKLPKVFFEEFMMLVDPLLLGWAIWLAAHYLDLTTFVTLFLLYFVFGVASVLPEKMPVKQQAYLILLSPFAFLMLYVINVVDYISLIHCLINIKTIVENTDQHAGWVHVDR